jgi:hypothetical protein
MPLDTDAVGSAFLGALKAPAGPLMRTAVKAWLVQEGITTAGKRNNPWNLHQGPPCLDPSKFCPSVGPLPGQIGRAFVNQSDQNVAVFATLTDGVRANANNLVKLQHAGFGYDKVIELARRGDPVGFLNALARSSWSAGRYGTKTGGPNHLVQRWNELTGRHDDPLGYKQGLAGPLLEDDDEVDPRTHLPLATCDVAGPTTVYADAGRTRVLIDPWVGATNVGLYAKPIHPTLPNGKASLVPIRMDLAAGPPEELVIGWVGMDRVSNIHPG